MVLHSSERSELSTNSYPRCEHLKGWRVFECEHGNVVHVPLTCRACGPCVARRMASLEARIIRGVLESGADRVYFLTLTSLPGATWAEIMRAWQKMASWIRRRYPAMQYACRKDVGASGVNYHLHVVMVHAGYIDQQLYSSKWAALVGAPVVWIRRLRGKGVRDVAQYVTKYVTQVGGVQVTGSNAHDYNAARKLFTFSKGFGGKGKGGAVVSGHLGPFSTQSRIMAYGRDGRFALAGQWSDASCECFGQMRLMLPVGMGYVSMLEWYAESARRSGA